MAYIDWCTDKMILNKFSFRNRNSRDRDVLLFGAATTIARAVAMLCAVIQVKCLTEYFSAEVFGLWSLTTGLMIFSSFLDFGLSLGMQNRISSALANNDKQQLTVVMSNGVAVLSFLAILAILVGLVLGLTGHWVHLYGKIAPGLSDLALVCFSLVLFAIVINIVCAPAVRLATAGPKNYRMPLIQCATQIASVMLLVLAIRGGISTAVVVAITMAPLVISPIILTVWTASGVGVCLDSLSWVELKHIFIDGLKLGVPQVCSGLFYQLPQFVTAQVFGLVAVGTLAYYLKMSSAISGVVIAGLGALWPGYANAKALGDHTWIQSTLSKSVVLCASGGGVVLILLVSMGSIVFRVLFGSKAIAPGFLELALSGLWIMSSCLGAAVAAYYNGTGRYRDSLHAAILNAVVLVPAVFLLIPSWGVSGALAAMLIAHAFVTLFYMVKALKGA